MPRRLSVLLALTLGAALFASGCTFEIGGDRKPPREIALRRLDLPTDARAWTRAPSAGEDTPLSLPRNRRASLSGPWVERDTLWDDTALVYAVKGGELGVLDSGAGRGRRIWKHPEERGSLLRDPSWSADGSTLYIWLNLEHQLCAVDVDTGRFRSLTDLPFHAWHWSPWHFLRHLDPEPESRPAGVVEDASHHRVLLLLDEDSNSQVAFWQRRLGRGGSWLAAVDLHDGTLQQLFDKSQMLKNVVSWDLSLERGRLYALTLPLDFSGYWPARPRVVEERRLDGSVVRLYAEPDGKAQAIQLSPDGGRLLIERSFRPGFAIPPGDIDDMTREQVHSLVENDRGGWLVVDLDTDEIIDGPHSGEKPRWAPDGDRIVTVDGWAVTLHSLGELEITPLIEGGAEDWGLGTWIEPVWSPDGRRLAITGRVLDTTLLLDLERREYLVLHEHLASKLWAPSPKPFAEVEALHERRRR